VIELSSISELIETILNTSPRLVGIDGKDGSGKSTAACEIAKATGASVISLDDFIDKGKGTFADNLRYEEIGAAISKSNGSLIVEGVCLLNVIDRLGVKLDVHVYVKRISRYGFWYDIDECAFHEDHSDVIQYFESAETDIRNVMAKSKDSNAIRNQWKMPEFRQELIRYHAQRTRVRHQIPFSRFFAPSTLIKSST